MKRYSPKDIEPKWQQLWQERDVYKVDFSSDKPKYFGFSMFNYPSGAGIHIGHALTYTISDVKSRFKRQQGYESYHPVGWDAFGLPAENYAIKAGVSPQQSMAKIIPSYHTQYQAMGWSNDWSKEVATHRPEYYKWTQWLFIKMYEEGLAYQDAREQWFCEQCQTVLSDAQVIEGKCWRHDSADDPEVAKKDVKQWFFKITDYADELLDATRDLNWTESVKLAQENWIGRSEGINITYEVADSDETITCFTTTPVNYGMTFLVLAPEHPAIDRITTPEHNDAVGKYVKESIKKADVERMQDSKEKTGVFTGAYAINQLTGKKVPIWVADFVLINFGTGAVQGCPAHDERDYEFAKNFDLPIPQVVAPEFGTAREDETFADGGAALAFDPESQKYAALKVPDSEFLFLPAGGLNDDEDRLACIARELSEEAGLTDIAYSELVTDAYGHYHHKFKKLNRFVRASFALMVLASADVSETALEGHEQDFELVWVTADELLANFESDATGDRDHYVYGLKQVVARNIELGHDITSSPKKFTTEAYQVKLNKGIRARMVNSGQFDGVPFDEAMHKTMDHFEEQGWGERKVNYKMRDWSVARQRYWGAPIPVVNCVGCYVPESSPKVSIDYAHHAGFVWAKEGKKTVLTRAKTPELANVVSGDILEFKDNKTDEIVHAKATAVTEFMSVQELFDTSDYPKRTFNKDFSSANELRAEYNSNRTGYAEQLDTDGIIVIEFTILKKPVVLKEADLPVILPELEDFAPSGDGRSALARAEEWLKVECPDSDCGGMAERETDTLDTYVCSSWYMMRYLSPGNDSQPVDPDVAKKWWNVDFYNGADHATAHLLYARFISRFLHKIGYLPEPEPFANFLFNGKLTAQDGTMFSKSKGNGVDPIEIIEQGYGADALRTYLMFAAPLEQWIRWDPQGVPGTYRFLGRLWGIVQEYHEAEAGECTPDVADTLARLSAKLADKVSRDIEDSKYNTAIAASMGALNELYKLKEQSFAACDAWKAALETSIMCIAPFAPHITDELWQQLGHEDSVHVDHWPEVDESLLSEDMMTIVVQVNGKVRANISVTSDAEKDVIIEAAGADENAAKFIGGAEPKKVIYVPGKLVNFVV